MEKEIKTHLPKRLERLFINFQKNTEENYHL